MEAQSRPDAVNEDKTDAAVEYIPGASASIIGVNALGTQPLPPTTKLRLNGNLSCFALLCIAPETATTSWTRLSVRPCSLPISTQNCPHFRTVQQNAKRDHGRQMKHASIAESGETCTVSSHTLPAAHSYA